MEAYNDRMTAVDRIGARPTGEMNPQTGNRVQTPLSTEGPFALRSERDGGLTMVGRIGSGADRRVPTNLVASLPEVTRRARKALADAGQVDEIPAPSQTRNRRGRDAALTATTLVLATGLAAGCEPGQGGTAAGPGKGDVPAVRVDGVAALSTKVPAPEKDKLYSVVSVGKPTQTEKSEDLQQQKFDTSLSILNNSVNQILRTDDRRLNDTMVNKLKSGMADPHSDLAHLVQRMLDANVANSAAGLKAHQAGGSDAQTKARLLAASDAALAAYQDAILAVLGTLIGYNSQ